MPIFPSVPRMAEVCEQDAPFMSRGHRSRALPLALLVLLGAGRAHAQEVPSEAGPPAGGPSSTRLGPTPGAGGAAIGNPPGTADATFGGRPGPSVPRVPATITRPGQGFAAPAPRGIAPPAPLPITEAPLYGPLALPGGAEDEGPPE